jgi:hypothetical protein
MRPAWLLFLIFIHLNLSSSAACYDSIPSSKNLSLVKLTNGSVMKGYIINVSDSSISFLSRKNYNRMMFMQQQTIPAEEIEGITRNFKNGFTAGKGMLYGFLLGFGFGFALGLDNPDDCTDAYGNPAKCSFIDKLFATKNFRTSLIAGGLLGSVGLVIGIFSHTKDRVHFNINGSRNNLVSNKTGLSF